MGCDRNKPALDEIPALIDQFRQSVLAAAFRGDLTADWRKKNPDVEPAEKLLEQIRDRLPLQKKRKAQPNKTDFTNLIEKRIPLTWYLTKIRGFCESSFYGPRFGKDEYTTDGVPSIRTTDMTKHGQIIISDETPRLNIPPEKLDLYKLVENDLLITRTGSIGMIAIFKGTYTAIPSAYLIRFRFTSLISVDYLYHYLKSPIGQSLLGLSSTAVTQPNINAEAIKDLPIPICSYDEQMEIVKRVEKIFSVIDLLENQHNQLLTDQTELNQSILAKAFRGELIPQDPNDEPASALLDHIRAEREKLGATQTQKRSSRKHTQQQ